MNLAYENNQTILSTNVSYIFIKIDSPSATADGSYRWGEFLKTTCEELGWKVLLLVSTPKENYYCEIRDGVSETRIDHFKLIRFSESRKKAKSESTK